MPTSPSAELHWSYYRSRRSGYTDYRLSLKDRLAKQHDRLALEIAHRMIRQCPVELEDLAQICRIGLLKAIERYNPATGAAFSSFAVPYIEGEVKHFLRDHWGSIKIPRRAIETASKVKRLQRCAAAMGRDIDAPRIAAAMGISASKWRWTKEATESKPIAQLDEGLHIPYEVEEEGSERAHLHAELFKRLGSLPDDYRHCLMEKFFTGLSDEAIAKQQGVEVQQVRQWIEQGLTKLRGEMTHEHCCN